MRRRRRADADLSARNRDRARADHHRAGALVIRDLSRRARRHRAGAAARSARRAGAGKNAAGARLHALRRSARDIRGADSSRHIQQCRRVRRADPDGAVDQHCCDWRVHHTKAIGRADEPKKLLTL